MLVEGKGLSQIDLNSFRGHLLIGLNFFSLLKLFIWELCLLILGSVASAMQVLQATYSCRITH